MLGILEVPIDSDLYEGNTLDPNAYEIKDMVIKSSFIKIL